MAQAACVLWPAGSADDEDSEGGQTRSEARWLQAHEELSRLARERAGLDFEEGRWLLRALREGTHLRLGYGSFAEYVERLFGYGPRWTQEKLRVAEALEELPISSRELAHGKLAFSAARELTRVVTRTTEAEWLAAARGKTARDIERLVSGRHPGDRPDDLVETALKRHVIRLEVSGEAFTTFREAMAKVRRDAGGPLDDDAAILLLGRHALGGLRDEGRSSYQVALTVCERCGTGRAQGRGELVEVGAEVVAMAACDAQSIGNVTVESTVGAVRATQAVPPAVRRAVLRRDGGRCRVPGCRHATFVDVHHVDPREEGGRHGAGNLITLCGAHHRAIHRGELELDRDAEAELRFRHADGTPYGDAPSAMAADVRSKAFRALRALGFRERQARSALDHAHVGVDTDLAAVVRAAVSALTHGFEPSPRQTVSTRISTPPSAVKREERVRAKDGATRP